MRSTETSSAAAGSGRLRPRSWRAPWPTTKLIDQAVTPSPPRAREMIFTRRWIGCDKSATRTDGSYRTRSPTLPFFLRRRWRSCSRPQRPALRPEVRPPFPTSPARRGGGGRQEAREGARSGSPSRAYARAYAQEGLTDLADASARVPFCTICETGKVDSVLCPCGHCVCAKCAPKLPFCPFCRGRIEVVQRFFL